MHLLNSSKPRARNSLLRCRSVLMWTTMRPLILFLLSGFALRAAAQDLAVYDDARENGWQDYGWATINYANAAPVHSGSNSIRVNDPGTSYQALFMHHNAVDPSLYGNLS